LLAWQARKVRDYIDSHITGPILVADLCALVQRSEAHFSRSFKRTFGESPHAFVVRRRVELAAQYMLTTDASLSDIALRCGFTDQPHLCKHFRQAAGQTPAAWRSAHGPDHDENGTRPVERFATALRNGHPSPSWKDH
jgi:AraC family transcriptional regulator